VRHAAPAQGLCLLRVGYGQDLFDKAQWYDGQPRYSLSLSDPPASRLP